ncbi:MAG: carbohydrate esterase [Lachnospiraceae bacterium]|nr:carbohydrate esterase [Lachnospiraceae bacterium]
MRKHIIVAKDNTGDVTSVQDAIDLIPDGNKEPVTITIKEGIYKEVVTIPLGKDHITLSGEGKEKVMLTYDNYAGKLNERQEKIGTNNSATVFIDGNYVKVAGITFENSFYREGLDSPGRQAVAVNSSGEHLEFHDCAFYGFQDTLYVRKGSAYFASCLIKGDIDFIFGAAHAFFEECEIQSLYGGSDVDNGYVTAASTRSADPFGLIFYHCRLTADADMPAKTIYLGRPWHPSKETAPVMSSTVFIECELGEHIKEEGYTVMGNVHPKTERYFEYKNTGEGAVINASRPQMDSITVQRYLESKKKIIAE